MKTANKIQPIIAGLLVLLLVAVTACIPEIPKISPPEIPQTGTPEEEAPDTFPYIKYGEGQDFLKKPLFFITWTPDDNFFDSIPETTINWRVEWLHEGKVTKWEKQAITDYHHRNIHYIGYYVSPYHQNDDKPFVMPEYATVDIDGNPIHVQKPGMGEAYSEQYWMNILDPHWQDMLLSQVKELIDLGIEGVVVDDIQSNAWVIYKAGGTFDKYSMEGFTNYLKSKYTTSELKEQFDIDDINSFNLRDYIIENDMKDTWNKDQFSPEPITYEFSQFQLVETARFWRRYSSEIKEYAREKYGREIFFSFNSSPLFISTHCMSTDFIDYLTGEHLYFPAPKASVVIKLSEGLSPKVVILVEVTHNLGTLPQQTRNLFKYVFADIYSADGSMIADAGDKFMTLQGWNYVEPVSYDVGEAAGYVSLANAHPELYGLEEPAKVGVIHSIASRRGATVMPIEDRDVWAESRIKGILQMLLNLNVPTRIIVSGDGELITKTFTQSALQQYEVVILPTVFMISDSEVEALLNYAEGGGTVIQISDFATHDKAGHEVKRPQLQTLRSEGEHALGTGKWLTITGGIGGDYFWNSSADSVYLPTERSIDDPELVKFKNILFKYYSPEIETDAPITVNIRRYVDKGRIVLHLANYDYDQLADQFKPAGAFHITVSLPEGSTPSKATLYDFEEGAEHELELTVTDNKAELLVPSLYAYSIVELR